MVQKQLFTGLERIILRRDFGHQALFITESGSYVRMRIYLYTMRRILLSL